jgi:ferredoxin hydrogenase small subunit
MNKNMQINRRDFVKVTGLAAGAVACGLAWPLPVHADEAGVVTQRQGSVYNADANVYKIRKSQDNPMIQKLYDKNQGFLKHGPGGHKSHELLHTHYHDRSAGVKALKAKGIKLAV